MFLISELRRKDVINEIDGKKLGYVYDIEIDINAGSVSYTHLDVYKRQPHEGR